MACQKRTVQDENTPLTIINLYGPPKKRPRHVPVPLTENIVQEAQIRWQAQQEASEHEMLVMKEERLKELDEIRAENATAHVAQVLGSVCLGLDMTRCTASLMSS